MFDLERWVATDSHWQHLKPKFNPIVTRVFVGWFALAPVAIKAFETMPERICLPSGGSIALALPFTWWVLWWASFFYGAAFLIYTSSCPRFIKNYPDYTSYENIGHSPRWLVWEFYLAWTKLSDGPRKSLFKNASEKQFVLPTPGATLTSKPSVLHSGTEYVFEHNGTPHTIHLKTEQSRDDVRDLFWELFGRWSDAAVFRRYCAWVCFYLAIGLAGWVVAQNVWFVLNHLQPSK